jgi:hypothetical protein
MGSKRLTAGAMARSIVTLNAAYITRINESQKVVKEGSAKMVAEFRIGMVRYFGQVT